MLEYMYTCSYDNKLFDRNYIYLIVPQMKRLCRYYIASLYKELDNVHNRQQSVIK